MHQRRPERSNKPGEHPGGQSHPHLVIRDSKKMFLIHHPGKKSGLPVRYVWAVVSGQTDGMPENSE